MAHKESHIASVIEKTESYIKTTTELLKMQAIQKTAESFSGVVTIVIIGIVFLHFFIFLNLGLALWVSTLVNSYFLGFLIFGLIYGVVFIALYINRENWLMLPIREKIIEEAMKDEQS